MKGMDPAPWATPPAQCDAAAYVFEDAPHWDEQNRLWWSSPEA